MCLKKEMITAEGGREYYEGLLIIFFQIFMRQNWYFLCRIDMIKVMQLAETGLFVPEQPVIMR